MIRSRTSLPVYIIFLLLFFFCGSVSAEQTNKSLPYYIEWDPVDGAGGYSVEVRTQTGESVLKKQFAPDIHATELNLPAGQYQFRLVTLNKFLRSENATNWVSIEVLTYSPPQLIQISPESVETGTPLNFILQANHIALDMSATLVSPDGTRTELTIRMLKRDTFNLVAAALKERGKYTLELINPPDLITRKIDLVTVVYPDPVVTSFNPQTVVLDDQAENMKSVSIEITGKGFSPETKVLFVSASKTKSNEPLSYFLDLEISNENKLVCNLPKALLPGSYILQISNASDLPMKIVGNVTITAKPFPQLENETASMPEEKTSKKIKSDKKPPKELTPEKETKKEKVFHNWLSIGGGFDLTRVSGSWAKPYNEPIVSIHLTTDFYLTNNFRPKAGHTFDFSLGLRADVSEMKSQDNEAYIESSLLGFSLMFCPAVTTSFPFGRIRFYAGGGLNEFILSTRSSTNTEIQEPSIDPLACSGIVLEYPLGRYFVCGAGGQFTCIFNPVRMYKYSAMICGLAMIPLSW